jgi:hypothetical protein
MRGPWMVVVKIDGELLAEGLLAFDCVFEEALLDIPRQLSPHAERRISDHDRKSTLIAHSRSP